MITIVGARGFIGSAVRRRLEELGLEHAVELGQRPGWVVWCAGVTGDFRDRSFGTVEAHVGALSRVLEGSSPEGVVYLSSTRVYSGHHGTVDESTPLVVRTDQPDDLYNVSKAMGESLCMSAARAAVVLRLSHVYGPDDDSPNFLSSLIRDAIGSRHVELRSAPDSARDYVHVDVVTDAIVHAVGREEREIYNVASGAGVRAGAIVDRLRELTGCTVSVAADAPLAEAPAIDIRKARALDLARCDVLADLPGLIEASRARSGRARR